MRKVIFLLVMVALILQSCAPVILYNKIPCQKSKEQMVNEIINICREEGMSLNNELAVEKGALYFKSDNTKTVLTTTYYFTWKFTFNENNEIIAYPKLHTLEGYALFVGKTPAGEVMLGDKTYDGYTEYWNVRAQIEKLCGCKTIVIFEDSNKKSMKEESLR